MRVKEMTLGLLSAAALLAATAPSLAADDAFAADLSTLQHEWEAANYQATEKHARETAFAALVEHAAALSAKYPDRAEAVAWDGIVLSTYAGEVGAMSAMKYAKAARAALERAEKLNATALDGGIYASLGALYSKVPGGMMGFGDDALAAQYFQKALAVDPSSLDTNYFYGEFLMDQGEYLKAAAVLNRALEAPPVEGRPIFDAGRRAEIRKLLETAKRKSS
jgi:tetratricopeptide (TPR) repeat protein